MRKFNFALTALIALAILNGQAQTPPATEPQPPIKPYNFLGTKTPYTAPVLPYTPPPAGYTPVFINYVGRHGARFLTKAGADVRVWETMQAAEKNHSLTPVGRTVKAMTEKLLAIEKDKYEQITLLGKQEQTALGERMLDRNATVFKGRGLKVVTTYKLRTQQSAEAFLKNFSKIPGPRRYEKAADSLDAILRFYDLSPAYQRYKKSITLKQSWDSLNKDVRRKQTAQHIWKKLFTAPVPDHDPVAFADNLYDLYSIQFSLSGEMQEKGYTKDSIDLGIAFDQKDLEWLDELSGAQDFLEKGPGFDPLGIQVRVAAPLLVEFLSSTEKAVQQGDAGQITDAGTSEKTDSGQHNAGSTSNPAPDAILRFTHAEAISPFAALLGIPQASTPAASIFGYPACWQAAAIIPLSANIQWILYSNGKDWLVKVLLNEKEVALPVAPASYPYYRWEDLERYYEKRLGAIHAGVGENMLDYLKTLK